MRNVRTRGDAGKVEKTVVRSASTKWMAPNKCHGIFFYASVRLSTLEYHYQQEK